MSKSFELLEFARCRRDLARRARGWTDDDPADRARLLRYAEDLEQYASELERQATNLDLPRD